MPFFSLLFQNRAYDLESLAEKYNLQFRKEGAWLEKSSFESLYWHHRGRKFSNVIFGRGNSFEIYAFDFIKLGRKGRDGAYTPGICVFAQERFCPFLVRPTREAPKESGLDFPEHPIIRAKYLISPTLSRREIRCLGEAQRSLDPPDSDETKVRTIFSPRVLRFLTDNPGWSIRGEGPLVQVRHRYTKYDRRFSEIENVERMIIFLLGLAREFTANSH